MKNIFTIAIIQDSGKEWDQAELIQLCKKHGISAVFDARFICKKNVDKRFFITISNKWLELQNVLPESKTKKDGKKVYYLARDASNLTAARNLMERLLLQFENVGLLVKPGAEVKNWHVFLMKLADRFPATKVEILKI